MWDVSKSSVRFTEDHSSLLWDKFGVLSTLFVWIHNADVLCKILDLSRRRDRSTVNIASNDSLHRHAASATTKSKGSVWFVCSRYISYGEYYHCYLMIINCRIAWTQLESTSTQSASTAATVAGCLETAHSSWRMDNPTVNLVISFLRFFFCLSMKTFCFTVRNTIIISLDFAVFI